MHVRMIRECHGALGAGISCGGAMRLGSHSKSWPPAVMPKTGRRDGTPGTRTASRAAEPLIRRVSRPHDPTCPDAMTRQKQLALRGDRA